MFHFCDSVGFEATSRDAKRKKREKKNGCRFDSRPGDGAPASVPVPSRNCGFLSQPKDMRVKHTENLLLV